MCSTLTKITIYYIIVSLALVDLLQHKLSFNMYDFVEFFLLPIIVMIMAKCVILLNKHTYSIAWKNTN